jgi:hypothetical protein
MGSMVQPSAVFWLLDPQNLLWLVGILCIFLAPFLVTYSISKRFEKAEKTEHRFSYLFWLALFPTVTYCVLVIIWSLNHLWDKVPFVGNEILAVGAFLMYLFLLKLREKMTGEDSYDHLIKFVVPMLIPWIMLITMISPLHYAGEEALGSNVTSLTPLTGIVGFSLAFYFVFLSYLECNDLLKNFRVIHKPLILSAFLILATFSIWHYNKWCNFLFVGTPLYEEMAYFASSDALFYSYWDIEMLPGLFGSLIALANMFVLHSKIKEPVPEIKKEEVEVPCAFSLFQFITKISEVVGGTAITIFRSAIDGYNKRFNRNIEVADTIRLSNVKNEEWPEFIEFVLRIFNMCIGPITWEEARQVEGLEKFVEGAERGYGKL